MSRKKPPAVVVPPPPPAPIAKEALLSPKQQVIAWLIAGEQDAQIAASIARLYPGADVPALMAEAVEHFIGAAYSRRELVIGWAMEAYRDLYRRTLNIGDFQGAMKALQSLVSLAEQLPAGELEPEEPAAP